MCGYCSQLGDAATLAGEALITLLLRLHYGVDDRRLELLGGERLWPVVMGQIDAPLPRSTHFDFGCISCSTVLRLAMNLHPYRAEWSVLLDHQPRSR